MSNLEKQILDLLDQEIKEWEHIDSGFQALSSFKEKVLVILKQFDFTSTICNLFCQKLNAVAVLPTAHNGEFFRSTGFSEKSNCGGIGQCIECETLVMRLLREVLIASEKNK